MTAIRGERRIFLFLALALLLSLLANRELPAAAAQTGWTDSDNVSQTPAESRTPALAVTAVGTVHVVWEEDTAYGRQIYHAYRSNGDWTQVGRVATGERPDLTVAADGELHLLWANEFGGNFEIYASRWDGASWSLPRNVSSTSGQSSTPAVALADDGKLHVAWTDTTPGYAVIYHAWSTDGKVWSNFPVSNARGGVPDVASSGGAVHLSWQDASLETGKGEIYHSLRQDGFWSLPQNISDSPAAESSLPRLAVMGGTIHHVWQEAGANVEIYYSGGHSGFWTPQENVSQTAQNSQLPTLAAGGLGRLHVAWDEAGPSSVVLYKSGRKGAWSVATSHGSRSLISDPAVAVDALGTVHLVWTEEVAQGNWEVFYSRSRPLVRFYLPLSVRNTP